MASNDIFFTPLKLNISLNSFSYAQANDFVDAVTDAVYRPCTLQEALDEAYDNVCLAARNAASLVAVGMRLCSCV